MKTITLLSNETTSAIHNPTQEDKVLVQQILSYHVKGYEQMTMFKEGRWDGTASFFKWSNSAFPAGFLPFLAANLKQNGYEVRVVKKPLPVPLGPVRPKVGTYTEDPRYEYQYEAVDRLIQYGGMVAQISTGGGKSRIAELAFARINRPTLFITTRALLMYQMKARFEADFGIPVSVIGDGEFGLNGDKTKLGMFTVAMVQTLNSRLKGPEPRDREPVRSQKLRIKAETEELLKKFEFIVLEEAHESSGFGYFDVCNHCKRAAYRLALTATPFMKDDEESNMRLMAVSGPIGIRVTEKQLIDSGILAKPYFKFVRSASRPKYLQKRTQWQSAYRIGIVENDARNQQIVEEAKKAKENGLSVMCLVLQKAHGALLKKMMREAGLKTEFIFGENNADERQQKLNELKNRDIDVLIGSTILDVGVDVPAVGMVILAGGGKAEVALRQRIGRGLRAKKKGPNVCFVVDFDDQYNNHLINHAAQRRAIVVNTPGFAEGVVDEFPYHLFRELK